MNGYEPLQIFRKACKLGTALKICGTVQPMTTLREYRVNLGWSQNELASQAGTSQSIIKRAEDGVPIQARTAKAIADTFVL